jgi:hypothetical protein
MPSADKRQETLSKLINARNDLDDALTRSATGARYDPEVIPQSLRNELFLLRDDLARIILRIQEVG